MSSRRNSPRQARAQPDGPSGVHKQGQRVDGRAARWAGTRERRRAEFVDAALVAIAEDGPEVSTERIAAQAGVARTRLYRYFTDAADLNRAIAERAQALVTAELEPLWSPHGSVTDMIAMGMGTFVGWIVRHRNLYGYVDRHTLAGATNPIEDLKTSIATDLRALFGDYLAAFSLDTRIAEPLAFGIVGLVETATSRWLEHPNDTSQDELTQHLVGWIWLMIDQSLRARGVSLNPDVPLPPPTAITALAGAPDGPGPSPHQRGEPPVPPPRTRTRRFPIEPRTPPPSEQPTRRCVGDEEH